MNRLFSQSLFVLSFAISLTACGNSLNSQYSPDESSQEPVATVPPAGNEVPDGGRFTPVTGNDADRAAILAKYDYLDPQKLVPTKALENAVIFFDQNKARIKNKKYLSVIDFKQNSKAKRFYIIDMKTGAVWRTYTSHGKGSDANRDGFAEKFSNVSGSNASSLGYYLTAESYYGEHGLALRLDGLSSTNSNARRRAIVIHGAAYVSNSPIVQGRSWGCPAVALEFRDKIVHMLKEGSVIYAVN